MKRVGLLVVLGALLLLVLILMPPAAPGTAQSAAHNPFTALKISAQSAVRSPQSFLVPPVFGANIKANSDSMGSASTSRAWR